MTYFAEGRGQEGEGGREREGGREEYYLDEDRYLLEIKSRQIIIVIRS